MKILISALAFCFGLSAAAENHGVIRVLRGDVKITTAKSGKTVPARLDQEVSEKDVLIAGKNGYAKIIMDDNNAFQISPNTTVEIQTYSHAELQQEARFLLHEGRIRFDVKQHYTGTSRFQVKTPNSAVGVRGTDFMVSHDATTATSTVVTFRGAVEFGDVGPQGEILNPVKVGAGERSVKKSYEHASAIEKPSAEELHKLDRESSLEKDHLEKPDGKKSKREKKAK